MAKQSRGKNLWLNTTLSDWIDQEASRRNMDKTVYLASVTAMPSNFVGKQENEDETNGSLPRGTVAAWRRFFQQLILYKLMQYGGSSKPSDILDEIFSEVKDSAPKGWTEPTSTFKSVIHMQAAWERKNMVELGLLHPEPYAMWRLTAKGLSEATAIKERPSKVIIDDITLDVSPKQEVTAEDDSDQDDDFDDDELDPTPSVSVPESPHPEPRDAFWAHNGRDTRRSKPVFRFARATHQMAARYNKGDVVYIETSEGTTFAGVGIAKSWRPYRVVRNWPDKNYVTVSGGNHRKHKIGYNELLVPANDHESGRIYQAYEKADRFWPMSWDE